jgi:hypothetical protein
VLQRADLKSDFRARLHHQPGFLFGTPGDYKCWPFAKTKGSYPSGWQRASVRQFPSACRGSSQSPKEVFPMKYAAVAVAMLALAGTPVLAQNPVEPSVPGSDKSPGVTPNDAKASPPKDTSKPTGATNPETPDPTKNTPGAESKN